MFCPYCNSPENRVIDKRGTNEDKDIRRRRECVNCKKRFTTYEQIKAPLVVIKRDKSKEDYNFEKIKSGVMKALNGRPVSDKKLERFLDDIDDEIKNMKCSEITSKLIGEIVTERLKKLDKVAYVRFMSHFNKDFKDVKTFKRVLR